MRYYSYIVFNFCHGCTRTKSLTCLVCFLQNAVTSIAKRKESCKKDCNVNDDCCVGESQDIEERDSFQEAHEKKEDCSVAYVHATRVLSVDWMVQPNHGQQAIFKKSVLTQAIHLYRKSQMDRLTGNYDVIYGACTMTDRKGQRLDIVNSTNITFPLSLQRLLLQTIRWASVPGRPTEWNWIWNGFRNCLDYSIS